MKKLLLGLVLVGCGAAPKTPAAENVPSTTAPALASPAEKTVASKDDTKSELAVPAPALAKSEPKSMDPLAIDPALEASSVPKIEVTPKKELRAKTRGDLAATAALVQKDANVEDAAKHATARLGKPSWIENGNKRVWVAMDGAQCHRLVLGPDGSVDLDTFQKTERTMLSALARQNVCTGEIERGVQ